MALPLILWVDDDLLLARTIVAALKQEKFDVVHFAEPDSALEWLRTQRPDAIILDVDLQAERSGLDLCHLLRHGGWTGTYSLRASDFEQTPILMLTGRDSLDDKVNGVRAGSDIYMPKHDIAVSKRDLDLRLLVSYLQSFLLTEDEEREEGTQIRIHELAIDTAQRRVVAGSSELDLTQLEYDLLLRLARHPGLVQSREVLSQEIWGFPYEPKNRTIDATVRRLRQKLEDADCQDLIGAKHGVGYFIKN